MDEPGRSRWWGTSTLYIYVTHKIALFYLDHGLRLLDVDFPGIDALKAVPIVAAAVLFGRWARRTPWAAWLFAAPWTLARHGKQKLASA